MYNKTIIRFGFCDIQKNLGLGEGYFDLDYSGYHKNLIQQLFRICLLNPLTGRLYRSANDPRTANDPGPQMIPKLDRKRSLNWTANDPGSEMIPDGDRK